MALIFSCLPKVKANFRTHKTKRPGKSIIFHFPLATKAIRKTQSRNKKMTPLLALMPHRTWHFNALFFEDVFHFHNNQIHNL